MSYINKLNERGPLICKVCGAPINLETMQCDYCGANYRRPINSSLRDWEVSRISNSQFDVVDATVDLDMEKLVGTFGDKNAYGAGWMVDNLPEIIKDEIISKIAEKLLPYINFEESYSIRDFKTIIRGSIRVLPIYK